MCLEGNVWPCAGCSGTALYLDWSVCKPIINWPVQKNLFTEFQPNVFGFEWSS